MTTEKSQISAKDKRPSGAKSGINARLAAARAVMGVTQQRLALDVAISSPSYKEMSARDRAFARLVAATTLRRMGQIDLALAPYLNRPPTDFVKAVLRTGAAQLLFLGTPVHAAVGESVAVLKRARQAADARAAGMANAVLRRVSEAGLDAIADIPAAANLPDWLSQNWTQAYGETAMHAMAEQIMRAPPLDLSAKSHPERWADTLEAEVLPSGTVRKAEIGNIMALPGFDTGDWWVQDVSAALPVHILGDLTGKTALDMCAAPGGKTLQLAAAGATVTALDRSDTRLDKVRQNLERTQLSAKCIAVDAAKWRGLRDHDFDVVLLDAPCSATGTLRRRPDVMYTKSQKDVDSLTQVQARLLLAAARQVKDGGRLVYCTCSLQTEEGEAQIEAFLKARPDFSLNPILTLSDRGGDMGLQPDGTLRALPHFLSDKGGMDGFYIAVMKRNL